MLIMLSSLTIKAASVASEEEDRSTWSEQQGWNWQGTTWWGYNQGWGAQT